MYRAFAFAFAVFIQFQLGDPTAYIDRRPVVAITAVRALHPEILTFCFFLPLGFFLKIEEQ